MTDIETSGRSSRGTPPLIVLAQSKPWCSLIQRSFPNLRLSWVLDTQSLIRESQAQQGCAAIVEIPRTQTVEFCRELSQLTNNSQQLRLFAVGGDGLLEQRPLLRASGFAAWFDSLLQAETIVRAIDRHYMSLRIPETSIESRVLATLPWPTATTDQPS